MHVSADVRIGALLKDVNDLIRRAGRLGLENEQVPQRIPERTQRQIEESVKTAQFDLWTGKDDKIMRRLEIEFSFDLPEELRAQAQGVERRDRRHQGRDRRPERGPGDRGAEEVAAALGASEPARRRVRSAWVRASAAARPAAARPAAAPPAAAPPAAAPPAAAPRRRLVSGGGTDLGTGGGPSVNSERSERYLKCLSDAKQPADIEKCSAILEK